MSEEQTEEKRGPGRPRGEPHTTVGFRLKVREVKELKKVAQDCECSVSSLIAELVRIFLAKMEEDR